MADAEAFGCPTIDGIDDVCRAFDSSKAIPQTVPEGVDDTSIRYEQLHPLVQRHTGRVGSAARVDVATGTEEGNGFRAVSGAKRSLQDRSSILWDEGLWNALLQIEDAAPPIEIGSRYLIYPMIS